MELRNGDPSGFKGDASRRQTALALAQTLIQVRNLKLSPRPSVRSRPRSGPLGIHITRGVDGVFGRRVLRLWWVAVGGQWRSLAGADRPRPRPDPRPGPETQKPKPQNQIHMDVAHPKTETSKPEPHGCGSDVPKPSTDRVDDKLTVLGHPGAASRPSSTSAAHTHTRRFADSSVSLVWAADGRLTLSSGRANLAECVPTPSSEPFPGRATWTWTSRW